MTAYAARAKGIAPEWAPLPVSYPDYVRWSAQVLEIRGSGQQDFWHTALDGLPAGGFGRPGRRAGEQIEFTVDGVERLTRYAGGTMFMVFQAVLGKVLSRHGFGEVIPMMAMAAGRGRHELTDLVGSFANRLVLRTDVTGDPGLAELVARIRTANLAAFDHADLPLVDLPLAGWPRARVVHHEQARLSEVDGVTGRLAPVPTGVVHAEVTLSFYEPPTPGPVRCVLGYATDSISSVQADLLVAEIRQTLVHFDKEHTPS
jgi:hypothetical protein